MSVHSLQLAADHPQEEHVPQDVPDVDVQEGGGEELPDVAPAENRVTLGGEPTFERGLI